MKNFNNSKRNSVVLSESEDDLDMLVKGSEFLSYYTQTKVQNNVEVFLDETIREPRYYRQVIQMLGALSESDTCTFFIETPGGNADGILALCEAVDACEGQVQAIITGQASSAGSLFALRCPNLGVSPNARMMIHAASFGYGGKHMDAVRGMEFQNKWLTRVFRQAYEGFLTESEIEQCLEGKEFWFTSDEIVERLEAREDYLETKAVAEDYEDPLPEEIKEVLLKEVIPKAVKPKVPCPKGTESKAKKS
jgi:ATP-dependent protease ClpP protease subunit